MHHVGQRAEVAGGHVRDVGAGVAVARTVADVQVVAWEQGKLIMEGLEVWRKRNYACECVKPAQGCRSALPQVISGVSCNMQ